MNDDMNICISASDKYIELGAITLFSVVLNGLSSTKYTFFIIDNGISVINKKRVNQLFKEYNVKIHYINASNIEKDAGLNINAGRWTLSTLQRLYISDILPLSVKRILYLDCDMLIRKPLNELYNLDLNQYIIAGVPDCLSQQNIHNIG